MSHRGSKALREDEWRRGQRHDGRADGFAGRPGRYSDQYYQAGYRSGEAMRRRHEVEPKCGWRKWSWTPSWGSVLCGNLSPKYEARRLVVEGWYPVCGIHARSAANAGIEVRDSQWVRPGAGAIAQPETVDDGGFVG